jgi:Autographiviridae endonuclease I
MAKPALLLATENARIKPNYKSSLEEAVAKQLEDAGIEFTYEGLVVPYSVPAREANYKADFPTTRSKIIIETKGHFGANNSPNRRFSNMKENSAKERHKFALLKEQHPELDIRFVFSRPEAPIYKGSPTTHAKWAEDHGFPWARKVVPQTWIDEMKGKKKR